MSAPTLSADPMWRVSVAGRVGASLVVVAWIALALGVTLGGGVAGGVLALLWVVGGLVTVAVWRWAFVPYVALTAEGVVVQNRVLRASVPYGDITGVQAGYYGVRIRRRGGGMVTAWAIQKSNLSRWAGSTSTRADEVAAAIEARARLNS